MEHKWATVPLILITALIVVFLFAYYSQGPEVREVEGVDFTEVNGDEYLDYDYISPEEEGIGDFGLSDSPSDYFLATSPEECDSFAEQDKDLCLATYANFFDDETACASVGEQSTKDDCFAQVAQNTLDAGLCDNIVSGAPECYSSIAAETNNASLCENAGIEKRQCLIAAQSGNYSDCAEGFQKRHCNDAATFNDPSYCDNITDVGEFCYMQVAINTGTQSLCNRAGPGKDHCFFKIATNTNNAEVCENLSETRDNCIAWVAINTSNEALCFRLSPEGVQGCIADVRAIN